MFKTTLPRGGKTVSKFNVQEKFTFLPYGGLLHINYCNTVTMIHAVVAMCSANVQRGFILVSSCSLLKLIELNGHNNEKKMNDNGHPTISICPPQSWKSGGLFHAFRPAER